jgi:hypothetical protein
MRHGSATCAQRGSHVGSTCEVISEPTRLNVRLLARNAGKIMTQAVRQKAGEVDKKKLLDVTGTASEAFRWTKDPQLPQARGRLEVS